MGYLALPSKNTYRLLGTICKYDSAGRKIKIGLKLVGFGYNQDGNSFVTMPLEETYDMLKSQSCDTARLSIEDGQKTIEPRFDSLINFPIYAAYGAQTDYFDAYEKCKAVAVAMDDSGCAMIYYGGAMNWWSQAEMINWIQASDRHRIANMKLASNGTAIWKQPRW